MTDTDIDVVYTLVNNMLKFGLLKEIDETLELNPKNMSISMMLSLLTVTLPAKSELINRQKFLDKCKVSSKNNKIFEGL